MERKATTGAIHFILDMYCDGPFEAHGRLNYLVNGRFETALFGSPMQMLLMIDEICDYVHYTFDDVLPNIGSQTPNADTDLAHIRHTSMKEQPIQSESKSIQMLIAVCFRRNETLQGYMELYGRRVSYRSAMELMGLMHELLLAPRFIAASEYRGISNHFSDANRKLIG